MSSHNQKISCYVTYCQTNPKIKSYDYAWTIPDFWQNYRLIGKKDSNYIKEQSFKIQMNIEDINKLKFFFSINDNQTIKCTFKIFITTTKGNKLIKESFDEILKDGTPLCEIDISFLRKNKKKYVYSNIFTIYFIFHVVESFEHNSIYLHEMYENRISTFDATHLIRNDNDKSDSVVTFVMNNEYLYTSKNLLCLKSSVFKSILEDRATIYVNEDANVLHVTDMKYDVLKLFVFFINTNTQPNRHMHIETTQELFMAAHRYNVKELKTICEENLAREITVENVVKLLDIALLNHAEHLQTCAKKFIQLHKDIFIREEEFIILTAKHPTLHNYITEEKLSTENANHIVSWYLLEKLNAAR